MHAPFWVCHFEFDKSDIKFVIRDHKNLTVRVCTYFQSDTLTFRVLASEISH
jgi:hypothetical protein